MIATTIEQSKELLRLGISPATADMWWNNRFVAWQSTPMVCIATEQNQLYTFKWCDEDVPAWSVSALMKVMQDVYPELLGDADGTWFCRCDKVESEYCDDQITAVCDVVCWLLDHNVIKQTKDND